MGIEMGMAQRARPVGPIPLRWSNHIVGGTPTGWTPYLIWATSPLGIRGPRAPQGDLLEQKSKKGPKIAPKGDLSGQRGKPKEKKVSLFNLGFSKRIH